VLVEKRLELSPDRLVNDVLSGRPRKRKHEPSMSRLPQPSQPVVTCSNGVRARVSPITLGSSVPNRREPYAPVAPGPGRSLRREAVLPKNFGDATTWTPPVMVVPTVVQSSYRGKMFWLR
jgi:hypothetical protein